MPVVCEFPPLSMTLRRVECDVQLKRAWGKRILYAFPSNVVCGEKNEETLEARPARPVFYDCLWSFLQINASFFSLSSTTTTKA